MQATTFRFATFDGDAAELLLTGLQLLQASGTAVAIESVVASHAPVAGSLAALIDGDPSTSCAFRASDVRQPSFCIDVTLAAAADVVEARMQGGGQIDFTLFGDGGAALQWQPIYDTRHTWDWYRSSVYLVPYRRGVIRCLQQSPISAGPNVTLVTGTAPDGQSRLLMDARWSGALSTYMRRLPIGTGDFTVEAWLKIDQYFGGGNGNDRMIVGDFANPTFILFLTNDNGALGLWDGARQHTTTRAKPAQQWVHVAAVRKAGVLRLFVDGISDYEYPFPNNLYDTGGWWQLFGNGNDRNLAGQAAELKFSLYAKYWDAFTPQFVVEPNTPARAWRVACAELSGPHPHPQGQLALGLTRSRVFRDYEFDGDGRIEGTVARKLQPTNLPLRRRVRLHRSRDGLLVRETWSKADGSYVFPDISRLYEYDVVAWDHEMSLRSVIANNIQAEVAP